VRGDALDGPGRQLSIGECDDQAARNEIGSRAGNTEERAAPLDRVRFETEIIEAADERADRGSCL
jgi:hypothetical protein